MSDIDELNKVWYWNTVWCVEDEKYFDFSDRELIEAEEYK